MMSTNDHPSLLARFKRNKNVLPLNISILPIPLSRTMPVLTKFPSYDGTIVLVAFFNLPSENAFCSSSVIKWPKLIFSSLVSWQIKPPRKMPDFEPITIQVIIVFYGDKWRFIVLLDAKHK